MDGECMTILRVDQNTQQGLCATKDSIWLLFINFCSAVGVYCRNKWGCFNVFCTCTLWTICF